MAAGNDSRDTCFSSAATAICTSNENNGRTAAHTLLSLTSSLPCISHTPLRHSLPLMAAPPPTPPLLPPLFPHFPAHRRNPLHLQNYYIWPPFRCTRLILQMSRIRRTLTDLICYRRRAYTEESAIAKAVFRAVLDCCVDGVRIEGEGGGRRQGPGVSYSRRSTEMVRRQPLAWSFLEG